MKNKITTTLIILCFTAAITTAQAQEMSTAGKFGIGSQVTSPAGISVTGWLTDNAAIASVASFSLSNDNSSFYIHTDYQMHKRYYTPDWDIGFLTYYYGVGGRYIWREATLDNSFFGIRLPGGVNFTFTDLPFDFYLEMAPVFEVSPDFAFGFNGGIGFRYYLN